MDAQMLAAAICICKSIPDTAAERAEAAQRAAEESAELAEQHSYGVSVIGTTLQFSKND